MGDFDPSQVDWGRVFAEAVAIALGFTKNDAEDVVQQGMTLLFDGTAPFDAASGKTLAQHLVEVGRLEHAKKQRTERRRRHPRVVAKLVQWFDGAAPPTPEELSAEREGRARAFEELLAQTVDDPEVQALVRLEADGVSEPAAQAERLGWQMPVVRNARKRLARRVKARTGSARSTESGARHGQGRNGEDCEEEDEEPP
jgi:DNA-directed RNA polymerase specialized sigma24 family protein